MSRGTKRRLATRAGPRRTAETRRGKRQGEQRPHRERRTPLAGRAEAFTHLRCWHPPSVQQRQQRWRRPEGRGKFCGCAGALRLSELRRRSAPTRPGNYRKHGDRTGRGLRRHLGCSFSGCGASSENLKTRAARGEGC